MPKLARVCHITAVTLAVCALTFLPRLVEARPTRVAVMNLGTATDSDRESAKNEALDRAEGGLICAGQVENLRKVSTGCIKTGDGENAQYVCTATATATCVIGF
jgi:hypothetical protein